MALGPFYSVGEPVQGAQLSELTLRRARSRGARLSADAKAEILARYAAIPGGHAALALLQSEQARVARDQKAQQAFYAQALTRSLGQKEAARQLRMQKAEAKTARRAARVLGAQPAGG